LLVLGAKSCIFERTARKRDARLLRQLLAEGRFQRVSMPSSEQKDLRTVAHSSLQAGADSRAGEERATALGHEPGCDEEEKTMEQNESARLLMTQPGVGPITAMAFVLTMGDVSRFQRGKQVASYLGLIPRE